MSSETLDPDAPKVTVTEEVKDYTVFAIDYAEEGDEYQRLTVNLTLQEAREYKKERESHWRKIRSDRRCVIFKEVI
jgi:hypothetical protein